MTGAKRAAVRTRGGLEQAGESPLHYVDTTETALPCDLGLALLRLLKLADFRRSRPEVPGEVFALRPGQQVLN